MEKKPSSKKLHKEADLKRTPDSDSSSSNSKENVNSEADSISRKGNPYLRFSNMGIQMGITIFLGVWGGMKLDEQFGTDPWLTVLLSLSGVMVAMYLVFRVLGSGSDKK
ncbi:MAG: ATP synthase protein I [Limisphaerales bacterium]|jgi:ATP synthase protein I